MEWKPIETAPKDGSCFYAFWPDQESVFLTRFDNERFYKKPKPHFSSLHVEMRVGRTRMKKQQPTLWIERQLLEPK